MSIKSLRGTTKNDWFSMAWLNTALDVDAGGGDDGIQGGA
jgi:hypothetical protein